MVDPTQTAAEAAAYGAAATFVALVGIEPQGLIWALVGAVFGLTWTPPTGRVRAAAVFVAVAFAAALLGTWAADLWHSGGRVARNGWSLGIAAAFHPLLAAFIEAVPAALKALIAARTPGGGSQQ